MKLLSKHFATFEKAAKFADLIPALLVVIAIFHFTVETPLSDDWDLIPILKELRAGHPTWNTFMCPYAGHRMPVFYVIAGMGIIATHWNSYFLHCLSFLFLFSGWFAVRPYATSLRQLLSASIFYWSGCQWADWFWTFTMSSAISICAILWTIRLLDIGSRKSMLAGAICAILGSFSYGAGLAVWPAALYLLFISRRPAWVRGLFIGAMVLIAAAYMTHGGGTPIHQPGEKSYVQMPLYALLMLGNPVGFARLYSGAIASSLGIILVAFNLNALKGKRMVCALLIAGLTEVTLVTLARGNAPPVYGGMDTRYGSMSMLFWVALALSADWSVRWQKYVMIVLLALCAFRSISEIPVIDRSCRIEVAGRNAVVEGTRDRFVLKGAQTSDEEFDEDVKAMRTWHYSFFGHGINQQ